VLVTVVLNGLEGKKRRLCRIKYSGDVLTDVDGVRVGHWTDSAAKTGCTVVTLPDGTVASGEIRGGAPATREFSLLDPLMMVQHVNAVSLSGGSAFGLATCDGVIVELERQGTGFTTSAGVVPIVVGMSLFDLAVGDATVRPGSNEGAEAFRSASAGPFAVGQVGAGTGATVNKWAGAAEVAPGGLATATERSGDVIVSALFAVNAYGAVDRGETTPPPPPVSSDDGGRGLNTTIGIVVTNARATKLDCHWLAQSAHDGLARSLRPAHTHFDGDGVVAAATGQVEADLVHLRALTQAVVAAAIRTISLR